MKILCTTAKDAEWFDSALRDLIDRADDTNYFFAPISHFIDNSEHLSVTIKNEDEALADVHNDSGSIKAFRAYNYGDKIVIFKTRYETADSVLWLFLHEIVHNIFYQNRYVYSIMKMVSQDFLLKNDIDIDLNTNFYDQDEFKEVYRTDDIHDSIPEEKLADLFATFVMGKNYSRAWWRGNIEAVDRSNDNGEV